MARQDDRRRREPSDPFSGKLFFRFTTRLIWLRIDVDNPVPNSVSYSVGGIERIGETEFSRQSFSALFFASRFWRWNVGHTTGSRAGGVDFVDHTHRLISLSVFSICFHRLTKQTHGVLSPNKPTLKQQYASVCSPLSARQTGDDVMFFFSILFSKCFLTSRCSVQRVTARYLGTSTLFHHWLVYYLDEEQKEAQHFFLFLICLT